MAMLNVLNNPRPHSPTGDLGEIAGENSKGCVREVSLAQVYMIYGGCVVVGHSFLVNFTFSYLE